MVCIEEFGMMFYLMLGVMWMVIGIIGNIGVIDFWGFEGLLGVKEWIWVIKLFKLVSCEMYVDDLVVIFL